MHGGCGLDITWPRMFYHESLQIRAFTKILNSQKYPLYGINFSSDGYSVENPFFFVFLVED